MTYSRRRWLKSALIGTSALALSPWDLLARETPNIKELAETNPVRLCFNENPFGISPKAKKAAIESANQYSQYSFNKVHLLKDKLAEVNNLSEKNIMIAAGSSVILELVAVLCALDKGHFIIPDPSFTVFSDIAEFIGMNKTVIPLTESKKIDLEAIKNAVKPQTKLIYICNPNNPTGDLISRDELINFMTEIPKKTTVLIDEAYIEFSGQKSLADKVNEFKNLVIARTFSKIYGMAGIRLGYAVACPELISSLEKLKSWSGSEVSTATLSAGLAALDDVDFFARTLENNRLSKTFTEEEFRKRNIQVIPSSANFIYFSLKGNKDSYFTQLKNANILGGKTYEENGLWTRISLGTPEEMNAYFAAWT